MNLPVEYRDRKGITTKQSYNLSCLAFVKHLAIAGQSFAPTPRKIIRIISMFFHYQMYIQRNSFNQGRFSQPPRYLSDPTEKGHFSNLAGKSIADFLSKRINNSIITVNYESAMRERNMSVGGVKRPDLLAFSNNEIFAIEAKGYSGGSGDMNKHKNQSKTGGIPVNFSVACVSYNLYNNIKCKYYDPYRGEFPFDNDVFTLLSQKYYYGLLGFLNEKFFEFREIRINGEKFFATDILSKDLEMVFQKECLFNSIFLYKLRDFYKPELILPGNIKELAKHGLSRDIKPFEYDISKNENMYIDNDRVGLKISG